MYQPIAFPDNHTPFLSELALGLSTGLVEALTYPLNSLAGKSASRVYPTTRSFLHYQEAYIILSEMKSQQSLTHGMKARLDQSISKHVLRYFAFNQLFYRNVYEMQGKQPSFRELSPEAPYIFPQLIYIDIFDPKVFFISVAANLISTVGSHPISVVKVMMQHENSNNFKQALRLIRTKSYNDRMREVLKINSNKRLTWFRIGFISRLVLNQVEMMTEIGLISKIMYESRFEFLNLNTNKDDLARFSPFNFGVSITLASAFSTLLTQPLFLYNQRKILAYVQREQPWSVWQHCKVASAEGISHLTKAFLPRLLQNVIRNSVVVGSMWSYAAYAHSEYLKPKH